MAFRTLEWRDGALWLLDQRKLPGQVQEVRVRTASETARAIREMVVRGAPAIGCAAAYGLALAAREEAVRAAASRDFPQRRCRRAPRGSAPGGRRGPRRLPRDRQERRDPRP